MSEEEDRLRRALHREAGRVDPSDRFAEIESRLPMTRRYLWPVIAAVVAAVVLVVGALIVVPMLRPDGRHAEPGPNPAAPHSTVTPTRSPQPPQITEPATPASQAATPSTGQTSAPPAATEPPTVPVYYLGASHRTTESGTQATRAVLFREYRPVTLAEPARPADTVAAAIEAMADQPPLDPDYRTAWLSLGSVDVTESRGALEVDLSGFPATLPEGVTAEDAMQQLVWTATAAYQDNLPVVVTVDGGTSAPWGSKLLGTELTRDSSFRAPIWIRDPATDQHDKAGKVTVSGVSTAFEGTVLWKITRTDTDREVAHGHAMGGANGQYAPFSFTVELKPGHYMVTVYTQDASGRGEVADLDSKTWYVD